MVGFYSVGHMCISTINSTSNIVPFMTDLFQCIYHSIFIWCTLSFNHFPTSNNKIYIVISISELLTHNLGAAGDVMMGLCISIVAGRLLRAIRRTLDVFASFGPYP